MKLDIGIYENLPTNKINGFAEKLTELIPSLYTHRCSLGKEGGFLERMRKGTWLGHVIEHVALELQCLSGMECGFGRTRSTEITGVYYVVFSYLSESSGKYAAQAAVRVVEALASGKDYDIEPDIHALSSIYQEEKLGPSTQAIIDEAAKRDIPYRRLDKGSVVMFGQGKNQRIICATVADSTSNIAVELVQDKQAVKELLEEAYVPVPEGRSISTDEELGAVLETLGFPVVIKPVDGNHGRGITANIKTKEQALKAFTLAKTISEEIVIERYVIGHDYRLLVVDYRFVAASKRTPAKVIGDGYSTIKELIDKENGDVNRGIGHEKILTAIQVDTITESILEAAGLTLDSVLPFGLILYLKYTANLSSGGTAEDVTDLVHPYNKFLAERTARLTNLNICGIDLIACDISTPLSKENGAILEVNAAPGFRMHHFPSQGRARNVSASVLDMLFPEGTSARIPVVAVTGTNGKTTTTRLIAHLAMTEGHNVGYTTTDGIYLNKNLVARGDCSGPASAAVVLRDPLVDYAVLECARGGILRSGLGFDKCNISIVTNISEDHLGMNGICDLEKLARVKSIVPESTFDDGFAILNADDDLVYGMKESLTCNIALFSLDHTNQRLAIHCSGGGTAAYVENGWLLVVKGFLKTKIIEIPDIPVTLAGRSECMVQNTLAAVLAAILSGFSIASIKSGLQSFFPSPESNPGRMNIFHYGSYKLIVDYAHNVGGYLELQKYLDEEEASFKTGIIGATGDRRDEDIIAMGELAAEIFDKIIIRHDKDGRGRTDQELSSLLLKGIRKKHFNKEVRIVSDERAALNFALCTSLPGSLIFLSSDDIHATLAYIEELKSVESLKTANYGT